MPRATPPSVYQMAMFARAAAAIDRQARRTPRAFHLARARRHALVRAQRMTQARAIATHTIEQWLALVAEFGGRCVRCGLDGVTKDHITPIFMGGSDGLDNLQPLCSPCNSGKGAETTNWVAIRRAEGFSQP
jgi:5-methylcytosine-specific restriction endonuclease McrA